MRYRRIIKGPEMRREGRRIRMGNLPTERRFWFAPKFHPGESALMHRQADNVWRIDFQLGWDADPEAEKDPARVIPRVRAALDQQGFGHIGFGSWAS